MSEGLVLVERYKASGLSQRAFAAAQGVTLARLVYWLRKVRSQGTAATGRARFVEVRAAACGEETNCRVRLELGHGMSLRFESLPSPSYLAQLASGIVAVTRC